MRDGAHLRKKYEDYRAYNKDYDIIATRCERFMGIQFRVEIDETYYDDYYPGWDCILPGVGKCDAKGSPTPGHLLVEQGRAKSKVFILCYYNKIKEDCEEMLGWATRQEVLAQIPAMKCSCCPKPTPFLLVNHIINKKSLHRMNELHDIVDKARELERKLKIPPKERMDHRRLMQQSLF